MAEIATGHESSGATRGSRKPRPPAARRWWLAVIGAAGAMISVVAFAAALLARAEKLTAFTGGVLLAAVLITTLLTMCVIADRKRAEEVLIKNSEALYSSLVESLPVQVLRKDLEGRFTFANKSFCNLLGKPFTEIIGKTDYDFYPAELAEKFRRDDRRVVETGELFDSVEENRQDDQLRYVQVMKSPVRDAAGKTVGVQVIFWDVTKRRQAEAALEQERYLLHALMDNLPHNIYFKDRSSRFIRINQALARWFGLKDAAEALGKTDFDYFTREHAEQAMADEQEVMRTGRPLIDKEEKETWPASPEHPGGHITWATTTKLPLYDEEGRIVGTFGISRDITTQKRAAEALCAAKEAAESASRAKSDFLANMSHEIRTPLNAVIGIAEMLLDTRLDDSQRDYLELLRSSGESLLAVINGILDFSKIEAGKLDLNQAAFDLAEGLGDTMKSLAVRASAKGLELACHLQGDVPLGLIGDLGRLRQVVINLVDNAIKFTEQGEVVLEVRRQSQSDQEVYLHFTVTDTGIGIPEDKRETIFEMFEQADSSTTRRFGGTGLGLAIARRLVESMGGRIWVKSQPDRGSTFHFTARFALAEPDIALGAGTQHDSQPAIPAGEQPAPPRRLRILLAEDSLVNQKVAVGLLERAGHGVFVANNGKEALAAWESEAFDLVLMDVQMPEMDGLEATAAIRAKEKQTLRHIPIVAMTAYALKGDRQRCLEAGMDQYLAKPIRAKQLFEAIEAALGASHPAGIGAAIPSREVEALDWSEALGTVKGDRKLLRSCVEVFVDESPRLLEAIRRAIADGEAGELRIAAHTLKGSMHYFAASRALHYAFELEKMGGTGDLTNAETALAALEAEMARLTPVLLDYLRGDKPPDA